MSIEDRINKRLNIRPAISLPPPMKFSHYRTGYSTLFRALLVVADITTYLYFFGVPFVPHLLSHLTSIKPVIDFFVKGLTR